MYNSISEELTLNNITKTSLNVKFENTDPFFQTVPNIDISLKETVHYIELLFYRRHFCYTILQILK